MLTPRNIVNYANPSSFNCCNEQQQLDFILHHEITKAQFEAIEAWFNGPNPKPAPFIVSGVDMDMLISNADCKTQAVAILGDITKLGHAEISIALMTYQEIQNNTLPYYIGAYGTDLFAGLMKIKNADAFHFCKCTYTYSTNPNQKLNGVIFIATANGTPVYYADYMPL
jgi:hypothetical protein